MRYSNCSFHNRDYYEFSRRALIGQRYKEALWSAQKAKKYFNKVNFIYYDSVRIQALSYIYLKRYEEAITLIKEHLYDTNKQIKNDQIYYEKLMLALIKAYYHKNKNTIQGDVNYLIAIFYKNFPNSKYHYILKQWKKFKNSV